MPIIENTTYNPSWLFKNKHFNTAFRTLFSDQSVSYKRERIELIDGDFIDLDVSTVNSDKVVIAIHGLEGSSKSSYILSLTNVLNHHGYDVVAINLRGCSGEQNRLISSYHSGKTDDLDNVIQHIDNQYNYKEFNVVGYSLGGNLTLKYMGEEKVFSKVKTAVGVSVPCSLKDSSMQMNLLSNRIYLNRFLETLEKKTLEKLEKFPDSFLSKASIKSIKNFKDFDDVYTAPAHGFLDAEDYYKKSSSKSYLPKIKTPTLLITSLDDPFYSNASYPFDEAKSNEYFFMEATKYGGHVGFGNYLNSTLNTWCEYRILSFLTHQK